MTKAESGLVQFSTYIAYFLMALPAGAFMKRYGYRKGIIMGLLLFAIGAFGFIPAAFLHSATPFLIAESLFYDIGAARFRRPTAELIPVF